MGNQDDQLEREPEEIAFENTPLELIDTDTEGYLNKPSCIRHLCHKQVRFNQATQLRDSDILLRFTANNGTIPGKSWRMKGCDVQQVKTEHDEFEEEELQNHQSQF